MDCSGVCECIPLRSLGTLTRSLPRQLFLGLISIGPWVAMLVYDLFLYVFRAVIYEVPVVGGRARGKARPRAPSLSERPSGRPRRFSLARRNDGPARGTSSSKPDASDARFRNIAEEKENSSSTE